MSHHSHKHSWKSGCGGEVHDESALRQKEVTPSSFAIFALFCQNSQQFSFEYELNCRWSNNLVIFPHNFKREESEEKSVTVFS